MSRCGRCKGRGWIHPWCNSCAASWLTRVVALAVAFFLAFLGPLLVVDAFAGECETRACEQRVKAKKAWNLCVKRHGANFCTWRNRWRRTDASWRNWAYITEGCESGHNPRAHSPGGHHGSMQFTLQTAWAAGFNVDPHLTTIYEQRVRAIRFARRHGTGHWTCSPW